MAINAGNTTRRSTRDRSHQKTPLQQLEEISPVVSGMGSDQLRSTEGTAAGILATSEVNPMAPMSNEKKRSSSASNRKNEVRNSY